MTAEATFAGTLLVSVVGSDASTVVSPSVNVEPTTEHRELLPGSRPGS